MNGERNTMIGSLFLRDHILRSSSRRSIPPVAVTFLRVTIIIITLEPMCKVVQVLILCVVSLL